MFVFVYICEDFNAKVEDDVGSGISHMVVGSITYHLIWLNWVISF